MQVAWSMGHGVLTLRGELDEPAVTAVTDQLTALCREEPLRIFVDLTEVVAVRGTVLGRLATVVSWLREKGCPLLFINPSAAIREQMHRHGLEGLLQLDTA